MYNIASSLVKYFKSRFSDGPVHQRGSCQNVNLHPAKVFTLGEFLGVYINFSDY